MSMLEPQNETVVPAARSDGGIARKFRSYARRAIRCLFGLLIAIVTLWTCGAVRSLDHWIAPKLATLLTTLTFIILIACFAKRKYHKPALIALCVLATGLMLFYQTRTPTHDRQWCIGQQLLPTGSVSEDGTHVTISNIRDFNYDGDVNANNPGDDLRYLQQAFDLNNINSVWLGIDRFADVEPVAHVFISFGFRDESNPTAAETYVAFSVETRREASETQYSPLRGIYNHYELIYVVATEEDMLAQRSSEEHAVQLYPLRVQAEQRRKMFLDIVARLNQLEKQPEFYHTLRSNCTNNIVAHANHAGTGNINMWQRGVIFPGWSDWLAMNYDLIDTELSLEEAREAFRINERVAAWNAADATDQPQPNFSAFIRNR